MRPGKVGSRVGLHQNSARRVGRPVTASGGDNEAAVIFPVHLCAHSSC